MGIELKTSAIQMEVEYDKGYQKALEDIKGAITGSGNIIFRHHLMNCLKELAELHTGEGVKDGN